jgi:hypothetical protein
MIYSDKFEINVGEPQGGALGPYNTLISARKVFPRELLRKLTLTNPPPLLNFR